jgi:hypothetical protein
VYEYHGLNTTSYLLHSCSKIANLSIKIGYTPHAAIRDRLGRKERRARLERPASGTIIRFVEIECRQICFVACKENERILSAYAINPGGTFTFDADNRKAAFRPQLQGALVKVVLARVEK